MDSFLCSPFFVILSALIILGGSAFWAIGILRVKQVHFTPSRLPSVSVIVAARNEESFVLPCLTALSELDYPDDLVEICFVDDHSTDNTRTLADEFAKNQTNKKFITVSAPNCPVGIGPKKNAIAAGVSAASGEILCFTDADCVVKKGWIRSFINCYDSDTGAVAGSTLTERPQNSIKYFFPFFERLFVTYTSASALGWGSPASVSGACFSYRRSVYDQLGGISHSHLPSGDDDLMAQAIARTGWKVSFATGRDSVVTESRIPTSGKRIQAAVRHQSTVKFYPLIWRAVYLFSIFGFVLLTVLLLLGLIYPPLLIVFASIFLVRCFIEGLAFLDLRRKINIEFTLSEFLLAEATLPSYTILRSIVGLFPAFTWKDRTHTR